MHEGVGVICFIAYSIFPTYFLARWLVCRFGKNLALVERSYRPDTFIYEMRSNVKRRRNLWIGMELPGEDEI